MFLRRERKDPNETQHKLAPVADGPYLVKSVQNPTVVFEMPDRSVERVPRSRFTLVPPPATNQQLQDVTRPMTDEEIGVGYPTTEDGYLDDFPQK